MLKLKNGRLLAVILLLGVLLVACQPEEVVREVEVEVPVEVTRIITETVTEEGEEVQVTRVITEEIVVTATPPPVEEVSYVDASPDTYVVMTIADPNGLDPNINYETSGNTIIQNVYDSLIWYNHTDPNTFVPSLATEVPSGENGGVSEDGLTYTFNIREGVTFHNGNDLTPSDVAYTFQRGLIQSDPSGPQWLFIEPIMGYSSGDITEAIGDGAFAGDQAGLIAGATPEELLAVCDEIQTRIVADDAAGTVTFNLAQPWGPFLATIAGSWGAILDQDWAVENGAWDGSCETWQNFYAPGAENDELNTIANGTGPYMLDHWTPGEELVMVANPNYWRTEPMWEGGPSGVAEIDTIITQIVDEWGTRFAAFQAGDAESVTVNLEDRPQVNPLVGDVCFADGSCEPGEDPNQQFRMYRDLPNPTRSDIFMVWNIATDEDGNNPYIGSGELDGNGIPPDFFSDVHVRKAFAYCFNYDLYNEEVLQGEGVRNNGPIIVDMLGYNPDGPTYDYDPDACAAELAEAWGGVLPDTGFRVQVAYNTGNTSRQTQAEILASELSAINPLYQVEFVGLPWPTFLRAFNARQLPVIFSGWAEDIHDPHNWAQPYMIGTYAGRQGFPDDVVSQFSEVVTAGAVESDPAAREEIYFDLQELWYEMAPTVILFQSTARRYEQRWVEGWFYNPILPGTYYYGMSLDGG